MAASTRALVRGLTLDCPFRTRETVWCETPARRATSCIPGRRLGPVAGAPGSGGSTPDAEVATSTHLHVPAWTPTPSADEIEYTGPDPTLRVNANTRPIRRL